MKCGGCIVTKLLCVNTECYFPSLHEATCTCVYCYVCGLCFFMGGCLATCNKPCGMKYTVSTWSWLSALERLACVLVAVCYGKLSHVQFSPLYFLSTLTSFMWQIHQALQRSHKYYAHTWGEPGNEPNPRQYAQNMWWFSHTIACEWFKYLLEWDCNTRCWQPAQIDPQGVLKCFTIRQVCPVALEEDA